jgi:hypothetical protein
MKKHFGLITVAVFIAGSVFAANTNKVSSTADKHPLPTSVQKAMDQSKEINKLSKQIAKEMGERGQPIERERGQPMNFRIKDFQNKNEKGMDGIF